MLKNISPPFLPERAPGANRGAKSLGKNQHRFGGTRDGTKQRGMWNGRNIINGRIWDEKISEGAGFAHFDRRDAGSYKIDAGMRDENKK